MLIAVVLAVVVLSIVLEGVIRFSSNTHRNSVRQTRIEKAKLVAESEMEYLFFQWVAEINRGTASSGVEAELITDGVAVANNTINQTPFSSAFATEGWTVSRTVAFYEIPGTVDGSATGQKPGTSKVGRNYYFTARVRATIQDPIFGTLEYRAGRRFVRSETSVLQFSVFYQDDMEIASGANMVINGPLSTNGSAYIGAQSGVDIIITDEISVLNDFNGSSNPLDGMTHRKPGAAGSSVLHDPIFDPNPNDADVPDQPTARGAQVKKLTGPENFVGGVNVGKALTDFPEAYENFAGIADANEVYRSVIAPPPEDENGLAISEDPIVASRRMYNRAGLVVTVSEDVNGDPVVNVGTPENPTAYNSTIAADLDLIIPPDERRKDVYDKREQRTMKMTSLDVGALTTALGSNAALASAYNGVIYIHDATVGDRGPGDGAGIRLKNGASTPALTDADSRPKGFAVVTNNALYIQGDYNTTPITDGGTTRNNPAVLMGDAVTILSDGWSDDNSALTVDARRAVPAGGSSEITLNAGILTGNTPSGSTPPTNSGGVQNLVRLLEDWSGYRVTISGSMGQLFASKYMNSEFRSPSKPLPDGDLVYWIPDERRLNFDRDLARRPPVWTPTTTEFNRGDFFTW